MSGPYDSHARSQVNSRTQPAARFWPSYRELGGAGDLGLGEYDLLSSRPAGIWGNDIDVIYVPPNWNVRGTIDHHYGASADFNGSGSQNAGFPGVYWNFNISGVGIQDIDHLWITQKQDIDETDPDGTKTVPYTWDRFRGKCCVGALTSDVCGIHQFGTNGNDCNDVYKNCKGSDLKIPYGSNPPYRSQYCSKLAQSNNSIGDLIKEQYCTENPTDSFCSCMNLTNNPEYIRWSQLMNAKHPEIVISPLMYLDVNGYNPCRKHLTTDMQTQFIPSELIAQIGHLPTSYSISDLTVSGNNNVLSNVSSSVTNTSTQLPSNSNTTPAPDKSNTDKSNSTPTTQNYTNYLLILFVIIIAIICAYSFTDDEPQPLYQQQY
jgi:hypothetical protein